MSTSDDKISYYRHGGRGAVSDDNFADLSRPLVINCCGRVHMDLPFTTDNRAGRHDQYLMYVTSGEMDAVVNGEAHRLGAGDLALYPPETAYRYAKVGDEPVVYYWVHFTGSAAEAFLTGSGFSTAGVWHVGLCEGMLRAMGRMFDNMSLGDRGSDVMGQSQLLRLLAEAQLQLKRSRTDSPRVQNALRFIHQSYREDIKVEQLARLEHLSVSRFSTLFRETTGMAPMNYVIRVRIENACELLSGTDLSVRQVAQLVGYDDPHYFSRHFRELVGVTASRYRAGEGNG